jgi:16S rRNA G966 N2-methylase RsmD
VRRLEVAMLCPAGLESVVAAAAGEELSKLHVTADGPGFLRGIANASATDLRGFRCATNVFNVVACVARSTPEQELTELARSIGRHGRPSGLPGRGTFRLRVHDDGHFAATGEEASALEQAVARWSGFGVSPRGAQLEFWVIRRRDQPETILATKLTGGNEPIAAGSLRPEICAALAQLAKVRRADLVVDPFAGTGGIGAACVDAGARRVWLNDRAPDVLREERFERAHLDHMRLTHLDLAALDDLVPEGSVSAVVTDPPWGHHDEGVDVVDLHGQLGAVARRWLHYDGTLVVLTGAEQPAVDELVAAGRFDVHRELPILVNGHKARVLQLAPGRRR